MIELFFVTCLMTDPKVCEEHSITLLPEVGIMGCMMTAQPQLAQWSLSHPDRRIARWTCRPVAQGEAKA